MFQSHTPPFTLSDKMSSWHTAFAAAASVQLEGGTLSDDGASESMEIQQHNNSENNYSDEVVRLATVAKAIIYKNVKAQELISSEHEEGEDVDTKPLKKLHRGSSGSTRDVRHSENGRKRKGQSLLAEMDILPKRRWHGKMGAVGRTECNSDPCGVKSKKIRHVQIDGSILQTKCEELISNERLVNSTNSRNGELVGSSKKQLFSRQDRGESICFSLLCCGRIHAVLLGALRVEHVSKLIIVNVLKAH